MKNLKTYTGGKWIQVWAGIWICLWVFCALFADIIATSIPWKARFQGETVYPVISYQWFKFTGQNPPKEWLHFDWKSLPEKDRSLAPVPFSPGDLDFGAQKGFQRHILGADELGRDVLSRIIHSAGTALYTGLGAMFIALFLGLFLGGISGYFGDEGLQVSASELVFLILSLPIIWFYCFYLQSESFSLALQSGFIPFILQIFISLISGTGILFLFFYMGKSFNRIVLPGKRFYIWMDILVSRLIEIKQSIPALFLILSIAAITEPSTGMMAFLIGITAWTPIARFVRAELLRIREEEYILAAKTLGYSSVRILLKHALPNALSPVWALLSFGIAGAILAEASLSFIRETGDAVSWGSMLSSARKHPEAWWLAVFPGLTLFFTIFSLNIVGEKLRDVFDPKFMKGKEGL